MIKFLIVSSIIIVVIFIILGVLIYNSKSQIAGGLVNGKLLKCSDKPNCVSSEYNVDKEHYISPINIEQSIDDESLTILKGIIEELGGNIQSTTETYIAAIFSSSIFRFVDDLEVRIDFDQNKIHLRSESRLGYSDFGVNRKRIDAIKDLYNRRIRL